MIKVFISQPMRDKTPEEIQAERTRMIGLVEASEKDDVEVIDSYFGPEAENWNPIECLGESIKLLAKADVAVFAPHWDEYRGCRIEHLVAEEYGVKFCEME